MGLVSIKPLCDRLILMYCVRPPTLRAMDSVEALQITNAELGMEVKEAKAETDTATN